MTGRFSRPFLGNWEPTTLSLLRLHLLRTSLMNMTTTAMNFTCLFIDLLLLFPLHFSWPPFFAISNHTRYQSSLHPCMHCRLFFLFFLLLFTGAAKTRRIPLGGAEPQATTGLAQKRCVRPVHLRDRGLCLSLGFTKKERKTLACRAASDTGKREVGSWMGPLRD